MAFWDDMGSGSGSSLWSQLFKKTDAGDPAMGNRLASEKIGKAGTVGGGERTEPDWMSTATDYLKRSQRGLTAYDKYQPTTTTELKSSGAPTTPEMPAGGGGLPYPTVQQSLGETGAQKPGSQNSGSVGQFQASPVQEDYTPMLMDRKKLYEMFGIANR